MEQVLHPVNDDRPVLSLDRDDPFDPQQLFAVRGDQVAEPFPQPGIGQRSRKLQRDRGDPPRVSASERRQVLRHREWLTAQECILPGQDCLGIDLAVAHEPNRRS